MTLRAASSQLSKYGVQAINNATIGQEKWFENRTPNSSGLIVDNLGSGFPIRAILVVNNSGGALLPGFRVLWDTSSTYGVGKAVGLAAGNSLQGAGIVSHLLPATGVPDDEPFWLITRGPTKVRADGDAYTAGAAIYAAASGRVDESSGTPRIGTSRFTLADTDADDLIEAFVDFQL